jgi:CDP-glycerol glycerophosphotransferase (TagB/SpsB family)
LKKEVLLLTELLFKPQKYWFENLLFRIIRYRRTKQSQKNIWIFCDRLHEAGDNAEALFEWVYKHHPEIEPYFILEETSKDYSRLSSIGKILEPNTFQCRMKCALAEVFLSSHFGRFKSYKSNHALRDAFATQPFIFLSHGITLCNLSNQIWRFQENFSAIITSVISEYNSILSLSLDYGYQPHEVWLTGLPRFDKLYNNPQKQITIIPTWRLWLINKKTITMGKLAAIEHLKKSDYYKFYHALITNPQILRVAQQYGYTICLALHPVFRKWYTEVFDNPTTPIKSVNSSYRDIFAKSDLILTDYSTAAFDFAYLKKPIIYAQFDKETFYSGKHTATPIKSFSYDKDGLGEVTSTLQDTIASLIKNIKNGCQLSEYYREKMNNTFAFNDSNNCLRVFTKVRDLLSYYT